MGCLRVSSPILCASGLPDQAAGPTGHNTFWLWRAPGSGETQAYVDGAPCGRYWWLRRFLLEDGSRRELGAPREDEAQPPPSRRSRRSRPSHGGHGSVTVRRSARGRSRRSRDSRRSRRGHVAITVTRLVTAPTPWSRRASEFRSRRSRRGHGVITARIRARRGHGVVTVAAESAEVAFPGHAGHGD